MKALKILSPIILVMAVFTIVFISPFVNFGATKLEQLFIWALGKYFIPQIVLGFIFGLIGLILIFTKNRIFKSVLFFLALLTSLILSGFIGSKFFSNWNINVMRGILPLIFIATFLILQALVIIKGIPPKSFEKNNNINSQVNNFSENSNQEDLKTKINNLKNNLSKPSFEILEEIESTGSFSGIDIEKIINEKTKEPKTKEPQTSESEVVNSRNRPEYDYNDLTELSFEKNKSKKDFEIIQPRRSETSKSKVSLVEVDDE